MGRVKWKRIRRALVKYGDVIVERMKDEISNHNRIATGELINTMLSYTEREDDRDYLYIEMAEYGQYVDSGRRPNSKRPPREPIRQWIDDKGIRPTGITKDQLSFLIQRSIGIKGIDPAPFLYLFYDHIDDLNDIISLSAREDIEDNINNYIKDFNRDNVMIID